MNMISVPSSSDGRVVAAEEETDSAVERLNDELERLIRKYTEKRIIRKSRRNSDDEETGVRLTLLRPPRRASTQVVRLYQNVHSIVVGLLEANRELSALASRDALTGVYNRSFFSESLAMEVARAERLGGRIMFIMVDIDGFKSLNDQEGHPRGDEVLRQVADVLVENVRVSDLVVRYGGDEFLIVAPRSDGEACEMLTARLKRAEEARFGGSVSFSLGCAIWSPGQSIDEAIARADERMYANKRTKKGPSLLCGG